MDPENLNHNTSSLKKRFLTWGPWQRWSSYRLLRRDSSRDPEIMRKRDEEQNESGRLPEGERVEIPVVWIVELYTPSTVSGLFDGISKLGWESDRTGNDRLSKWMNDVRAGRQQGWMNLGLVSPSKRPTVYYERTASLPDGVEAALPSLMSVTPSITALVMAFILTEEYARTINTPLRAYYSTQTEINSRLRRRQALAYILGRGRFLSGGSIIWPDLARRREVQTCLDNLEQSCATWVQNNLPGVFASGLRKAKFSTAMLMVTEKMVPLSEEARSIRAFDGLNLNKDYVAWKSDSWPLARLAFPDSWDNENLRLVFACRRSDGPQVSPGVPEPTSNWSIAQRAHDDLAQGLLSKWALICLLDGYHHLLSTLRDKAAAKSSYFPVYELKTLRKMLQRHLFDINIAAQEIREFVDSRLYSLDIHFEEVRIVENPSDLLQNFKSYQKNSSELIGRESNLLQSILKIITEMTQNVSNIRVQRVIVSLTIVSIVIAIIAIAIAASHSATP